MHRRPTLLLFCLLALTPGCGKEPRPPLLLVPALPVAPQTDAAVTLAPEPDDAEPGMPPDEPEPGDAIEGAALKRLLLVDPDRAAKALNDLETPDAWQVALLAQLALTRHQDGPDVVPESKMPEVLPGDDSFTADAGVAYVASGLLPLKASLKRGAPTVMQLPINTKVTVLKLEGTTASVSVEVATQVSFSPNGAEPKAVTGLTKKGVVDAKWLVTRPVDAASLAAQAATKQGSEKEEDEAVVLLHRRFLIERTEMARAELIDAAWEAKRASWVVAAAMAQLHVALRRLDVAWACQKDASGAQWVSFKKGTLPAQRADSMCLTHVDVRKPCDPKQHAHWQKRVDTLEQAGFKRGPVVQLVVDATWPRVLWFYAADLRLHDACAETNEYDLDVSQARIRRLVLPLGTAKTVVHVETAAYDGTEFGVVAAPNEIKARAWLRKRATHRWTLDPSGELNISLGVADTHFESEHDANGVTFALPPTFDCVTDC